MTRQRYAELLAAGPELHRADLELLRKRPVLTPIAAAVRWAMRDRRMGQHGRAS